MSSIIDKVLQEAKALSVPEQQRLLQLLSSDEQELHSTQRIEQWVAAQGTRPLNFEEMFGDFWPEKESTDEFLATLRAWRKR